MCSSRCGQRWRHVAPAATQGHGNETKARGARTRHDEKPHSDMTDQVFNVCFHGIGRPARLLEPGEDAYWISADTYHRILDSIAPRSDVRLSFDDGNISDVEIGLPGLLERGLTATFFPLVGRLDQPGSLGHDHVRELR